MEWMFNLYTISKTEKTIKTFVLIMDFILISVPKNSNVQTQVATSASVPHWCVTKSMIVETTVMKKIVLSIIAVKRSLHATIAPTSKLVLHAVVDLDLNWLMLPSAWISMSVQTTRRTVVRSYV